MPGHRLGGVSFKVAQSHQCYRQKLRALCSVSQIRKWTDRVTIDGH